MTSYDIVRPVGLKTPCAEIESTCADARIYRQYGIKPAHLVLCLDAGSGRTAFLEYMTDMYKKHGILHFTGGLDDFIEIVFDGTLAQLRQAFAEIDSAAVYSNEYSGIVGMDISAIALHLNEAQFVEFMHHCKRLCAHACVVFFVHSVPSGSEQRLVEKLCAALARVKCVEVEPYTAEDFCRLIERSLSDHGISVKNTSLFRAALTEAVPALGISCVKEALTAAEDIIRCAQLSASSPVVDDSAVISLVKFRCPAPSEKGRSEMK